MAKNKKIKKDEVELHIKPTDAFMVAIGHMEHDGGTAADLKDFELGIIDILKQVKQQIPEMTSRVNRGLWIMKADGEMGMLEPLVYRALIEEVVEDVKTLGIKNVRDVGDVNTPQELGQAFMTIAKQKGQWK